MGSTRSSPPSSGLPAGESFHLVLNNVILKDNRIPPRGFANAAFAAFDGAPVGASYEDGQHWDDVAYPVGPSAVAAEVTLWYQTASREYVEFLRDANVTNANGNLLYDLWNEHGKSEPVAMAQGYVEASPKFAEGCRKSVSKARDRYRKTHLAEWESCFEAEARGLTCDGAGRDAKLGAAEAALRDNLGGAGDARCAGANRTPSSLGHGTSCPVPCATITLFDMDDLADCTVCLAETLDGATLEAAWGKAPPALPGTTPPAAADCQKSLAKAATGLAADWTRALAKCEKANASGKHEPPADCSADPGVAKALEQAGRELERCADLSVLEGCGEVGNVDGTLACLQQAIEAPATGYVGAAYP